MTAKEQLRRQTSQLFEAGADPYNTADTVKVSLELVDDFVSWLTADAPDELAGDGHLRSRQAE